MIFLDPSFKSSLTCPSLIPACDCFFSLTTSYPLFSSSSPHHMLYPLSPFPSPAILFSLFNSFSLHDLQWCMLLSVCLSGILCVSSNPLSAAIKSARSQKFHRVFDGLLITLTCKPLCKDVTLTCLTQLLSLSKPVVPSDRQTDILLY